MPGGFGRGDLGNWHGLPLAAADFTRVAISYAIGQSAPMVAAGCAVFGWREFTGTGAQAKIFTRLQVRLLRPGDSVSRARP